MAYLLLVRFPMLPTLPSFPAIERAIFNGCSVPPQNCSPLLAYGSTHQAKPRPSAPAAGPQCVADLLLRPARPEVILSPRFDLRKTLPRFGLKLYVV